MCKKKASMTIELSLILPGIFAVIIFVIFFSFYFHDICLIEKISYTTASMIAKGEETDEAIEKYFDRVFDQNSLGKWKIYRTVTVNDNEIDINVSGNMNSNENLFFGYISRNLFSYETKIQRTYSEDSSYIRRRIIDFQNSE